LALKRRYSQQDFTDFVIRIFLIKNQKSLIIPIILKVFILSNLFKQKLVNLDHPEELFAVLNEIEEAYSGYEVV
jgi:hypothetical protein